MQSVIAIQQAIAAGKQTPRQAIARCFDAIAANDGELRAIRQRADREAVRTYARNLRSQLLAPPLGSKKVLSLRSSGSACRVRPIARP